MNHAFGSLSLLEGQTQDQVITANSNSARMACMDQTNLRSSSRAPKLQRTMGGNLASVAAAHRLRSIRTEKLSVGVHGSAQNQSNTGGYRYENEKNALLYVNGGAFDGRFGNRRRNCRAYFRTYARSNGGIRTNGCPDRGASCRRKNDCSAD